MKILALVLAIVFVVLAVLVHLGALSVPGLGFLGLNGQPHTKHMILYIVLALLCLVWWRFASAEAGKS